MRWVLVVEDAAGEAVLRRMLAQLAPTWTIDFVDDCRGVDRMRVRFPGYRNASRVVPHLLLADLDRHECPVALMRAWKAQSEPPRLLLRVAVREVEAWIMGDRVGIAAWLQIAPNKVPAMPEGELDAKAKLLSLGRGSRSRRLAGEFCPAPGSRASQGPLYNDHVTRFVRDQWNLDAARRAVPSLDRACRRILDAAATA